MNGKPISLWQATVRCVFYIVTIIIPFVYLQASTATINQNNLHQDTNDNVATLLFSLLGWGILYILFFVLILVDALFILIRKDNRALHDLIAGTRCMKN